MNFLGKTLVLLGIMLVVAGLFFILGGKIPWLGRLPGDIVIYKKNFTLYFPLTTCILISVVLTLVFFIFSRR